MPLEVPDDLGDLLRNPDRIRKAMQMLRALENLTVRDADGVRRPIRFSPHNATIDLGPTGTEATSGTELHPETIIWRDGIIAAGGTFASDSIAIADALIRAINAGTFNSKIKYLLPFLGADIIAARMPLRDALAVGIATNNNFVNADFSQATGLQGNDSTKSLNSRIYPSQLSGGVTGGLGWWEKNFGVFTNVQPIGCYSTAGGERFVLDLRSPSTEASWWGDNTVVAGSPSPTTGNKHYYGQCSSSSFRKLHVNGNASNIPNTTSYTPTGMADRQIYICAAIEVANAVTPWGGRGGVAYLTDGTLTDTEIADFHTLLQDYLMTPTGR